MIQSAMGPLTIDIKQAAYKEGTIIQGYPPGGGGDNPIKPNQSWQAVPDPLGSGHYLIVSGACNLCIGIGANVPNDPYTNPNVPLPAGFVTVTDDATDRGAILTLQAQEPVNNHYQLWDFVPVTGGAGNAVFIQNPQTGYVIELKSHSAAAAGPLVVNSRRISNDKYQLWTGVSQTGQAQAFPVRTMAQPGFALKGNSSYVFMPPNQGDHLIGLTLTVDIIEDLVCPSAGFSLQVNCNTPYLGPDGTDTEDYDRDAQWMQFGLFMQNYQLMLFNQTWHRAGAVPASEFPSQTETSAPLLQLPQPKPGQLPVPPTIPAGTRIILNLCTDHNDFAIGMTGLVLDSTGLPTGSPVYWPALGRNSFHTTIDGGKVHQKAMAPVGAFQVVFCSLPGGSIADFSAGMGTLTITASPGIAAQNNAVNPFGIGTAENSNVPYDLVLSGSSRSIVQPFGFVPPPFIPPH